MVDGVEVASLDEANKVVYVGADLLWAAALRASWDSHGLEHNEGWDSCDRSAGLRNDVSILNDFEPGPLTGSQSHASRECEGPLAGLARQRDVGCISHHINDNSGAALVELEFGRVEAIST